MTNDPQSVQGSLSLDAPVLSAVGVIEKRPRQGSLGLALGSVVRPRTKRMHMIDAGCNPCGPGNIAQFQCKRCNHESEWLQCSVTEIRRGIPCPKCNADSSPNTKVTQMTEPHGVSTPQKDNRSSCV